MNSKITSALEANIFEPQYNVSASKHCQRMRSVPCVNKMQIIFQTITESFGYAPPQNSVKNQFFPPGSVTGTSSRRLEYYLHLIIHWWLHRRSLNKLFLPILRVARWVLSFWAVNFQACSMQGRRDENWIFSYACICHSLNPTLQHSPKHFQAIMQYCYQQSRLPLHFTVRPKICWQPLISNLCIKSNISMAHIHTCIHEQQFQHVTTKTLSGTAPYHAQYSRTCIHFSTMYLTTTTKIHIVLHTGWSWWREKDLAWTCSWY